MRGKDVRRSNTACCVPREPSFWIGEEEGGGGLTNNTLLYTHKHFTSVALSQQQAERGNGGDGVLDDTHWPATALITALPHAFYPAAAALPSAAGLHPHQWLDLRI